MFWLSAVVLAVSCVAAETQAAAPEIHVPVGRSIQAAIDTAPEGATITLAAGTFRESLTITKPLTLQGAGWEKTTIRPAATFRPTQEQKDRFFAELEAAKDPEVRTKIAIAFANPPTGPPLIVSRAKGVTLRGIKFCGPPEGDTNRFPNGSLVTFDHASGLVTECAVVGPYTNGIAIFDGSDIQIDKSLVAALLRVGVVAHEGAKLVMRDCDVRNCYYCGITLRTHEATVARCRISGSAWHGIRYDDCSPEIRSNHIFGNARSGIYASGRSAALVSGNVFWRNEMDAMSCWFGNTDDVVGNTIIGNLREGISVLGGSKTNLVRNVFVDNPIGVRCGRIASRDQEPAAATIGAPTLVQNHFFGNPIELQVDRDAKPLPPDNRTADPRVGRAEDGFRLTADSPARKANAGAADPIALASPFALQPEETAIIPDSETRDSSKWKGAAAARR
jgi:hypothetical protein